MLIPFKELLTQAQRQEYAIGYFEAWDLYSLEAVVEAAEAVDSPVILGFGGIMMEQAWFDGGAGLERLGALGLAAARMAKVPVSFLLNEVATLGLIRRGIAAGFNAVMLDTSHLPYQKNVHLTRQVVEAAHAAGVDVEAELSLLPDASGEMGGMDGQLTDPAEATRFVQETGIDALGVSVGNIHILAQGEATIDWPRLAAIQRVVPVPLVIHGGTGFPASGCHRAISLGVAKINYGTTLKRAFLEGLTEAIQSLPPHVNYHQVMGSRKEADVLQQAKLRLKDEIIQRMCLWQNPSSRG
jgi:ketose-bisphosphate aldolase